MPDSHLAGLTVAVTGATGNVGTALLRRLTDPASGVAEVRALARRQPPATPPYDTVRWHLADLGTSTSETLLPKFLEGADAVVHLAAIVGDPACARDPELSNEVNVAATRELVADARAAGVGRLVFASTCSNYGRMADPTVPVDETAPLQPVSLYAEQKVAIEQGLLEGERDGLVPTCLRLATVYGVGERMRFDLTVNEFTRDLFDGRVLEVFGEQFWRPYLHVLDAASAIALVLGADEGAVGWRVFNVGHSDENYRKLDLVEVIQARIATGEVRYVHRDEDPRDYRVDFSRVRDELGFVPARRVPDGVEEIAEALAEGRFGDPYAKRFVN